MTIVTIWFFTIVTNAVSLSGPYYDLETCKDSLAETHDAVTYQCFSVKIKVPDCPEKKNGKQNHKEEKPLYEE